MHLSQGCSFLPFLFLLFIPFLYLSLLLPPQSFLSSWALMVIHHPGDIFFEQTLIISRHNLCTVHLSVAKSFAFFPFLISLPLAASRDQLKSMIRGQGQVSFELMCTCSTPVAPHFCRWSCYSHCSHAPSHSRKFRPKLVYFW